MDAAKDGSIWFTEQELTTASTYRGGAVGQCTSQGKITEYVLPNVMSDGNEYRALDGAAVSTDGSFWFAEPNNNRIGRRSKTGVFTAYALPTPKSRVIDIVAGKNDDVWFVMGDTDILGHITAQGKVTSYATPDSGGGSGGLAIDPAGNVWFTEYFADKIIKAEVSH
jgi:virginiamycin B lyase